MGHKGSVVVGGQSPQYFSILTGAVSADIFVTPGSHTYKFYHLLRKESLSRVLTMEVVRIPPLLVLVGHGHV